MSELIYTMEREKEREVDEAFPFFTRNFFGIRENTIFEPVQGGSVQKRKKKKNRPGRGVTTNAELKRD